MVGLILYLLVGIVVTGVLFRILKNTTKDGAMTLFFVCVWPISIFLVILGIIQAAITGLVWLIPGGCEDKEGT